MRIVMDGYFNAGQGSLPVTRIPTFWVRCSDDELEVELFKQVGNELPPLLQEQLSASVDRILENLFGPGYKREGDDTTGEEEFAKDDVLDDEREDEYDDPAKRLERNICGHLPGSAMIVAKNKWPITNVAFLFEQTFFSGIQSSESQLRTAVFSELDKAGLPIVVEQVGPIWFLQLNSPAWTQWMIERAFGSPSFSRNPTIDVLLREDEEQHFAERFCVEHKLNPRNVKLLLPPLRGMEAEPPLFEVAVSRVTDINVGSRFRLPLDLREPLRSLDLLRSLIEQCPVADRFDAEK